MPLPFYLSESRREINSFTRSPALVQDRHSACRCLAAMCIFRFIGASFQFPPARFERLFIRSSFKGQGVWISGELEGRGSRVANLS